MNIIQVPAANHFIGRQGYLPKWIILHGTAGFTSALDVANYFARIDTQASVHYIVGLLGEVYRCVSELDAAWANGPITGPAGISGDGVHHDSWWDEYPNPNFVTIAIEHVKPSTDNSDILTSEQKAASLELIAEICDRWSIPRRKADEIGGITGHFSMDPVNRSRCPGPYPWTDLWNYLGGHMLPKDWTDNGTQLVPPQSGHVVTGPFRDWILSHLWDSDNYPCENETHLPNQLELSNIRLGPGTRQRFLKKTLERKDSDNKAFEAYTGPELMTMEDLLKKYVQQVNSGPTPTPSSTLTPEERQTILDIRAKCDVLLNQ